MHTKKRNTLFIVVLSVVLSMQACSTGNSKKEALLKHFGSIVRLGRATLEQIAEAPGIGLKTAKIIREELDKK